MTAREVLDEIADALEIDFLRRPTAVRQPRQQGRGRLVKWLKVHGIDQSFDGHRGGWTEPVVFTCEIEPRPLPAANIRYPKPWRTRHWHAAPDNPVTLTVYAKTATEAETVARRARRRFDPTTGGK